MHEAINDVATAIIRPISVYFAIVLSKRSIIVTVR